LAAVIDNPGKVGFKSPILNLLDVSDPNIRAALLDGKPIFHHVRCDRIEVLIRHKFVPDSKNKFLFYFLSAKIFLEEFAALRLPRIGTCVTAGRNPTLGQR
jgi:asparagine synthase (glutamine-hydrolysing)